MSLRYRTRGQSDPREKNRVYFCCHPEDFSLYFDQISKEILELQDCAVWYDGDGGPAPLDEERQMELERMQLFIMPVTARLLTGENAGLECFRFAMEQHIPVLPLMQETRLTALFNKKCGDIQFLDSNDSDPTALPYQGRLANYLNSVLVGDEMAQKIRKAFDAYVFLSYRKKDRRHGQKLMRLIHRSDFCRDIAIWYDEFLVPGENFNDAIAAAMAKSQLFAMAVTPSLLDEKNYVMAVEYPEAQKAGKAILPAELLPTDRAVLEACYPNIPDCVDAHNEEALAKAMSDSLRRIALRKDRDDPAHMFFIGLAYLYGIDVETDRTRAAELITQAAEKGLPEAMEKLADMYRSGTGVERDYQACVRWMERLVEVKKQKYRRSMTEDTLKELDANMSVLCDDLACMNRWEDAKAVGQWQAECLEQRAKRSGQDIIRDRTDAGWLTKERAYVYARLSKYSMEAAELKEGRLNYEEAKSFAQQSIDLARREPSAFDILAMGYRSMMEINRKMEDWEDIDQISKEFLKISLQACETDSTPENRNNLAGAYRARGTFLWGCKRLDEAQEYYQKAEQLYAQLAEEGMESRALLEVYYALGRVNYRAKRLEEARNYFQRTADRSVSRAKKYGQKEDIRSAAQAYRYLGNISKHMELEEEATTLYNKSITLWEQIPDELMSAEDYAALASCYSRLGMQEPISEYITGDDDESGYWDTVIETKDSVEKSCQVWDRLAERYSNKLRHKPGINQVRLASAKAYMREGSVLWKSGAFEEAWKYYQRAEPILAQLQAEGMNTPEVRRMLAKVNLRLGQIICGDLYKCPENEIEAEEARVRDCCQKALELNLTLVEEFGELQDIRSLSETYRMLGSISKGTEGEDYCRRSISVWDRVEKSRMPEEEYAALADGYFQLYSLCADLEVLEKACRIWDELDKQHLGYRSKLREAVFELARTYMDKSAKLREADRPEEALVYDQKAEPLYLWLEENAQKDLSQSNDLFKIYPSLGHISLRKQKYDAAEAYFQQAAEIYEKDMKSGLEVPLLDLTPCEQISEGYQCLEKISYEKGEPEKAKYFGEQRKKYKRHAEHWAHEIASMADWDYGDDF